MSALPHIIVVGRYSSALTDWHSRIKTLSPVSMRGEDISSRKIAFMSVERPDRFRGCNAQSWEFSACASYFGQSRHIAEIEAIMKHRDIPYKETPND